MVVEQKMSNGVKFVLAQKIGMSQLFDREGKAVPVTLARVSPAVALQVKTRERDGYEAVQVGAGERKAKNVKKPQRGHFKSLGNFRYVREFRFDKAPHRIGEARPEGAASSKLQTPVVGGKIDASMFQEGDAVKVSGISKGKGFQGVVKRHGFHGAPASHGTKHAHREPGSIGGGGRAGGRVAKGMKMAGRMGGQRVTVRNLKIAKVDVENNLLAIEGAVPGRRGTLLEIRG